MSSPLPQFQYLVAFNNNAFDDPALITSIASPGVLGAVNVWTDITAMVQGHTYTRGRQHELDRFEAATCTLDVDNRTGAFNPWNSQGPYYGLLLPTKLMRIQATYNSITNPMFTGNVNSFPIEWPDNNSAMVQIQASDGFRLLALANIQSQTYKTMVLADGASSYYRLDELANVTNVANDIGTANADGIYVGKGLQGVTGALQLDPDLAFNTNNYGGFVQLSYRGLLSTAGAFSLECWVNLAAQPGSADGFFSQQNTASTHVLAWGPLPGTGSTCSVGINMFDGTNTQNLSTTSQQLPIDGGWHHVVVTRSGTTVHIYIDGNNCPLTTTANTGAVSFSGTSVGGIGAESTTSGGMTPAMNGGIDEFAIYPLALTQTQVTHHALAGGLGGAIGVFDTPGQRIDRVLTAIGWSAGARTYIPSILSGDVLQGAGTALYNTKALTHMQAVEQGDQGALFMNTSGQVEYVAHAGLVGQSTAYKTVLAIYGDGVGQFPYQPGPDLALDDLDLFNQAQVTRAGGLVQSFQDAASVATYGARTQALSGMLFNSDTSSYNLAQWLVAKFKTPVPRLRTITVYPLDNRTGGSDLVQETLARGMLDTIQVQRQGAPGVTDPFVTTATIEQITDTVTVDSWVRSYALAISQPNVGLWNSAASSRWGGSSPLTAGINASALALTVTVGASPATTWTIAGGNFPFNVQVDNEIMTVSAIAARSGTGQTFTISARGVNGTAAAAHSLGALVTPTPATVWGY